MNFKNNFFIKIIFSFLFFSFFEKSISSIQDRSQEVRVRIGSSISKFQIDGSHLKWTQHKKSNFVIYEDAWSAWNFSCHLGKIQGKKNGESKIRVFDSFLKLETPTGFFRFQGRVYRGFLKIYASHYQNVCDVVHGVDLDEYLNSLVHSEFSATWPPEAIAAQVIAARTYAYYQMNYARKKKKTFDLDATTQDQLYEGLKKDDDSLFQIIKSTRGWVLTSIHNPSQAIKAFYHSTCGGQTALPEQVWGGKQLGLNRSVMCPYCRQSPQYQWSFEISNRDLTSLLFKVFSQRGAIQPDSFFKIAQLENIVLQSHYPEGRVSELMLTWSAQGQTQRRRCLATELRQWLGVTKLKSTAFYVMPWKRSDEGGWVFQGKGYGHGVGLCQWGAKYMGEQGWTRESILKYYYPDAKLSQIW